MKNNEQLLKTIGEIDDKYISKKNIKRKKSPVLKLTAGVTACAAAAAGFFVMRNTVFFNKWEEYPVFPNAGYDTADFIDGAELGVPEYESDKIFCRIGENMLYGHVNIPDTVQTENIALLEEENPWTEGTELDTLPVFRNLSYTDSVTEPTRFLYTDQMLAMAENTAEMLGVDIIGSEYTELGAADQGVQYRYALKTTCTAEKFGLPDLKITVYSDGAVEIDFAHYDPDIPVNAFIIPEEYNYEDYNSADGEKQKRMADYLAEIFADVLQYENPEFTVYNKVQYGSNEEEWYDKAFQMYDRTDSDTRNIVNYGLNFADFDIIGNKLFRITLTNKLCVSDYIADYPVISLEEAEKLLLNGVYTSNVYEPYIKGEEIASSDVASAELVYRGDNSKYYIPYYRFYAMLEQPPYLEGTDINLYGAFYVPAVELKYLNMGYTLPDTSGDMLSDYPRDTVTLPDGSEIDKNKALRAYDWDGAPMLEFDFAFLRYADPIFQNTLDDPYGYDFETNTFNSDDNISDSENPSYFMVQKGDTIEGGQSVVKARFRVMWDKENNTQKYVSNIVEFDINSSFIFEGILRYFPEGGDLVSEGDMCFYPDPTAWRVPVSYTEKERLLTFADKNTALLTDGGVINVGNISDSDIDPKEAFKNGNCVKLRVDLRNLRFEDYAEENSSVDASFDIIPEQ